MGAQISRGRLAKRKPLQTRQSINPMESIVNMIDIMLIFACGLMVSIVTLWGLDVNTSNPQDQDGYQNIGQTYQDPETGKFYVVVPAAESTSPDATDGVLGATSAYPGSGD
ncbi:hypothetical protein FACS1894104_0320 [Actinomycetota bacterium]|nr:hypothetical protein FACS1894104_0320 [Actinomycetota bacterium]